MRKNMVKATLVAAFAGTVLQFSGCVGLILQQTVVEVFADFVGGFIPNLGDVVGGGDTTTTG